VFDIKGAVRTDEELIRNCVFNAIPTYNILSIELIDIKTGTLLKYAKVLTK